jgi:hypothetical protein
MGDGEINEDRSGRGRRLRRQAYLSNPTVIIDCKIQSAAASSHQSIELGGQVDELFPPSGVQRPQRMS